MMRKITKSAVVLLNFAFGRKDLIADIGIISGNIQYETRITF